MPSGRLLLPFALSAAALAQHPAYTAVPLQDCDRLLLAPVRIDGHQYSFLVDTGATTILNAASFRGTDRAVVINSYRGEAAMKGAQVRVRELEFGGTQLHDLNFKAIDLSAIGDACGGKVDGLLGVDLLAKLDASIDVKKRTAKVAVKADSAEYRALVTRMQHCNNLFNEGDTNHFREQFADNIVWIMPNGELRGREAVIRHLQEDYVRRGAKMFAAMKPEDLHIEGDTYWANYDCEVVLPDRTLRYRGTMVSKLHGEHWQVETAHFSPAAVH